MLDRLKHAPARLWAWLKRLPRRIGAWTMSVRGRIVWTRLLAAILLLPLAPSLTVVWKVMFEGGTVADQTVVIYITILILLIRGMRRGLKRHPRDKQGKGQADAYPHA